MESILFDGVNNPETLEEVVGQAVGAASVCWESMDGTGVFQDDRARQIVDDVLGWVNENYVPKTQLDDDEPYFQKDLARVVNFYSRENGSNTPDWILARLLNDVLVAFDRATRARIEWYENPEV